MAEFLMTVGDRLRRLFGSDAVERFIASGRGFLCFGMVFEPVEEKLIRLCLDDAASLGEQHNGAVALIQSLRRRGVKAEHLIRGSDLPSPPKKVTDPADVILPSWSKFAGMPIRSVSPQYLRFILWRCGNADPALLAAIRTHLGISKKENA